MKFYLGLDIGSSFVKAALVTADEGKLVQSLQSPEKEMEIISLKSGWAEQDPEVWWMCVKKNVKKIISGGKINPKDILAIGISYQMHGLVIVDKELKLLRHSIIWCDGRAVAQGEKTLSDLGNDFFKKSLFNYPGNFTASKLKWVKENEPEIYKRIYKFMLPGDYIALKLTGEIKTSRTGLSEMVLWDFEKNNISEELIEYYGFGKEIIPEVCDSFCEQGRLSIQAANELGLVEGTPVTYRAGDQPNNALSLNVLCRGEAAATAGTSGVIYYVCKEKFFDEKNRVNTFEHINKLPAALMCINGTAILYRWIKSELFGNSMSYEKMNELAKTSPAGSRGLLVHPFGNGAERILENKSSSANFGGLQFNIHSRADIIRAAIEGICFAFKYGLKIINREEPGIKIIKAGKANLFLSDLFGKIFSAVTNSDIKLYETNGAVGAAIGAGIGLSGKNDFEKAFRNMKPVKTIEPKPELIKIYEVIYEDWKRKLKYIL